MQTSNPTKNNYGRRRKRRGRDNKVARIARKVALQEIAKKETEEVERKFYDQEASGSVGVDLSGVVMYVSGIGQGYASNNRIGNLVRGTSLQLRYQLSHGGADTIVRFIVFRWFKDGVPAVTDVLADGPSAGQVVPLSMLQLSHTPYLQILYDNSFVLTTDRALIVDKLYINRAMKISWDSASVRESGHIYILMVSDRATSLPGYNVVSRLRFSDQ